MPKIFFIVPQIRKQVLSLIISTIYLDDLWLLWIFVVNFFVLSSSDSNAKETSKLLFSNVSLSRDFFMASLINLRK